MERVELIYLQRRTKAAEEQTVEPPEDAPVDDAARYLGGEGRPRGKQDTALLDELQAKDEELAGQRGGEEGSQGLLIEKPQSTALYSIKGAGKYEIDENDAGWTD